MQVSKPYPSFLSDGNLASMKARMDKPHQVTDDVVNNDLPSDSYAQQIDQVQPEENDYGDADADMGYGGDDD